jgi:hypothetical protein
MFMALTLTLEGLSWLGLWWLEKYQGITYKPLIIRPLSSSQRNAINKLVTGNTHTTAFSRRLGWEPKRNASAYKGRHITNSISIRHDREFLKRPQDTITRLSAFGDSFTEGVGVSNKETWQEQMMAMDAGLEVLNFGMGGYGPDQAFLRYLESDIVHHIAILGYLTENLNRVVNVYAPFYGGSRVQLPMTKPRFLVDDGNNLVLVPNPMQDIQDYLNLITVPKVLLPRLGEHDYYFNLEYMKSDLDFLRIVRLIKMTYSALKKKPIYNQKGEYNPDSEAFKVTVAVFEAFYNEALKRDALPVFLIFPTYNNLAFYYNHKQRKYRLLIDWLGSKGFLFLDLTEYMIEHVGNRPLLDLFQKDLHYSSFGNELVAKALLDYISKKKLKDREYRRALTDGR